MMDFHFWENRPFKSNINSIKWIRLGGSIQSSSGGSVSAYHYCTSLQQLCLCITSAEPVFTNLWTVQWAEMTSSLTCSSEGGVWTVSLHLCTRHAQSSSLFTSIYLLWKSQASSSRSVLSISFDSAFKGSPLLSHTASHLNGPLLSLKGWQAEITRRTAQTLYCFNSCYTVKRTKMFLLCQVPGW